MEAEGGRRLQASKGLARSAAVRVGAYGATVALGLVYAVVTARWLGPADKGILATLTFMLVLASQLACLGLGEAAIVLVGQRRFSLQRALSATLAVLAVAGVAATGVLAVAAVAHFWSELPDLWPSIAAACVATSLFAFGNVLAQIVNIEERFVATSVVVLTQAAVSAALAVLLVTVADLSILGAVLAVTGGCAVGLGAIIGVIVRRGLSLRPVLDRAFMRRALPYGLRVQISGPPPLTDRADLLLVYALGGQAAAGRYSVALTLGTLAGTFPLAISYVSFPRLARLPAAGARELTARTCRYALAAAILVGFLLLAAVPALPLVFGEPYAPAVVPAVILIPAYALASVQWLLGRAAAARGSAGGLVWSYGLNLAVMAGLGLALIPPFGITGAALAALSGSFVGLAVALAPYRTGGGLHGLRCFVPTVAEFRDLVALPRRVIGLAPLDFVTGRKD